MRILFVIWMTLAWLYLSVVYFFIIMISISWVVRLAGPQRAWSTLLWRTQRAVAAVRVVVLQGRVVASRLRAPSPATPAASCVNAALPTRPASTQLALTPPRTSSWGWVLSLRGARLLLLNYTRMGNHGNPAKSDSRDRPAPHTGDIIAVGMAVKHMWPRVRNGKGRSSACICACGRMCMHVYVLLVVLVICVLKVLGCDVPPPDICSV